jgi:hypothetical protein
VELTTEAQIDPGGAVSLLGHATWSRLQAKWPSVSGFFSISSFSLKTSIIFPQIYFHQYLLQKDRKMVLLKTA